MTIGFRPNYIYFILILNLSLLFNMYGEKEQSNPFGQECPNLYNNKFGELIQNETHPELFR